MTPSIISGRSIHDVIDHTGALKVSSPFGELTFTRSVPVIVTTGSLPGFAGASASN